MKASNVVQLADVRSERERKSSKTPANGQLPKGWYVVRIDAVTRKPTKNGYQLVIRFEVTEGEEKGKRPVIYLQTEHPSATAVKAGTDVIAAIERATGSHIDHVEGKSLKVSLAPSGPCFTRLVSAASISAVDDGSVLPKGWYTVRLTGQQNRQLSFGEQVVLTLEVHDGLLKGRTTTVAAMKSGSAKAVKTGAVVLDELQTVLEQAGATSEEDIARIPFRALIDVCEGESKRFNRLMNAESIGTKKERE